MPTDHTFPTINMEIMNDLHDLLGDSREDILQIYPKQRKHVQNLPAADENDFDMIENAHPLKSSSRQIGAETLGDRAEDMEYAATDKNEAFDFKKAAQDIANTFDQVKSELFAIEKMPGRIRANVTLYGQDTGT